LISAGVPGLYEHPRLVIIIPDGHEPPIDACHRSEQSSGAPQHPEMGQHCHYQAAVMADREQATEALESQAADVIKQARQLSAQAAVSYARRSQGPRQRPEHGWDSLTPTEREVVWLVTEGMSNPGIADRLFISRATVKTHLAHIFTKLDVINRSQLTALATRATTENIPGRA